jgi:hypothetical protein
VRRDTEWMAAVRAIMAAGEISERRAYRVLAALEELDWARPEVVRAIVASAGGKVIISEATLIDPPPILQAWTDPATGNRVIVAS